MTLCESGYPEQDTTQAPYFRDPFFSTAEKPTEVTLTKKARKRLERQEKLRGIARDLLKRSSELPSHQKPSETDLLSALQNFIKVKDLRGKSRAEVLNLTRDAIGKAQVEKKEKKAASAKRANEAHISRVDEQLPMIVQALKLLGVSPDNNLLKDYYLNSTPRILNRDLNALTIFSQNMAKHNNELSKLSQENLLCLLALSLKLQQLIVGKSYREGNNPQYVVQREVASEESQDLTLFSPGNILEITRLDRGGKNYPNLSAQIIIPSSNQNLPGAQNLLYTQRDVAKPGFVFTPSQDPRTVINSDGKPTSRILKFPDLVYYTQLKRKDS